MFILCQKMDDFLIEMLTDEVKITTCDENWSSGYE